MRPFTLLTFCAVLLLSGCSSNQPAPTPAPQKPPTPRVAGKPPSPPKGSGQKCNAQQPKSGTYTEVACPAACRQDGNNTVFDVDRWMTYGYDPDVCLHTVNQNKPNPPDTLTWISVNTNYRVVSFNETGSGNPQGGQPFKSGPPFPAGTGFKKGIVNSSAVDDTIDLAPGKCYVFKTHIEVKDPHGAVSCYDPHIYTGCSDCTVMSGKGSQ